jgi:endonuclease/exonuclease/phosphatase (EEP) superfamily protein YafD
MSWYGMGFYLPIDHLFHSKDFLVNRFEIGPDMGSDHFPLLAEFAY